MQRPTATHHHLPGRPADALVVALLTLPWVHPWAPGPEPNTAPVLIAWASLALLLACGRLPTAMDFARAWTWAALASSLMGLLQYFGEAAHLGGWVHVPAWLGDAVGNLRQRNQLATLTSLGVVAVLWQHRQGMGRTHALWMLALLALGNAATGSRTGLLQWLLLAALAGLWQAAARPRHAPWSWPLLLWALGLYLAASLVLPQALAAWQGTAVSSAVARMGDTGGCGSRSVLWANVLQLIGQHPWVGWGWNELKYAHYMAQYPGTRFCDILGNAHNLPLQLAFAFGVPATLALMLLLLGLLLRARPWRLSRPESSLAWSVLAMVGVHSLLEYPLWYGPFQVATLGALWLLWPARTVQGSALRRPLQALALLVLALTAVAGADYLRMRQIYLPASERLALWRDEPWPAAQRTLFFAQAVRFAEVTTTPVSPDNAARMLQASLATLHYSPEPRVIDQLIESARLSGQPALARWHSAQKLLVYGNKP